MLQAAIECEVAEHVQQHVAELDADGHRLVVGNGSHPARIIQTGCGSIEVKQPRVYDKRVDEMGELLCDFLCALCAFAVRLGFICWRGWVLGINHVFMAARVRVPVGGHLLLNARDFQVAHRRPHRVRA